MPRTIEVSDETYEKIKDQLTQEDFDVSEMDDLIGKKWFIRTVTYHFVGKIRSRVGGFWIMDQVSWVADSGRFMQALAEGKLNEVEPMPNGTLVNIASITDMAPWKHALPKDQK